jgi:hypothetical protein
MQTATRMSIILFAISTFAGMLGGCLSAEPGDSGTEEASDLAAQRSESESHSTISAEARRAEVRQKLQLPDDAIQESSANASCTPCTGGGKPGCVVISRFNHRGCMMPGSTRLTCAWNEDFVVAPDRTIWHSWPTSGRWVEMPNNGRADDMLTCAVEDGNRTILVIVTQDPSSVWRSFLDLSTGIWHGWFRV